jgi:hypothetical protein
VIAAIARDLKSELNADNIFGTIKDMRNSGLSSQEQSC